MEDFPFRVERRQKFLQTKLLRLFCKVVHAIKYLRSSLEIVLWYKIAGTSCSMFHRPRESNIVVVVVVVAKSNISSTACNNIYILLRWNCPVLKCSVVFRRF